MSTTSSRVLDTAALYAAVLAVATHRRMSLRAVARETGLAPNAVTRLGQGARPDADALLALLEWLGHDMPYSRPREPLSAGEGT